MKSLIVLSGLPGSGKTTWAKNYKKNNKNTYILCLDMIRFEVTKSFTDFSKQDKVWKLFNGRLKELSKKKNVNIIVDSLNHKNKFRLEYLKDYPDFDNYTLVILNKNVKDLIHFNKCRSKYKWVKDIDIKKLAKVFEYPSEEVMKKYDEVIFINDYA